MQQKAKILLLTIGRLCQKDTVNWCRWVLASMKYCLQERILREYDFIGAVHFGNRSQRRRLQRWSTTKIQAKNSSSTETSIQILICALRSQVCRQMPGRRDSNKHSTYDRRPTNDNNDETAICTNSAADYDTARLKRRPTTTERLTTENRPPPPPPLPSPASRITRPTSKQHKRKKAITDHQRTNGMANNQLIGPAGQGPRNAANDERTMQRRSTQGESKDKGLEQQRATHNKQQTASSSRQQAAGNEQWTTNNNATIDRVRSFFRSFVPSTLRRPSSIVRSCVHSSVRPSVVGQRSKRTNDERTNDERTEALRVRVSE